LSSEPHVPIDISPELRHLYFAPPRLKRRYWLHILLFFLTVFTTLLVGARLQAAFELGKPMFVDDPEYFFIGWLLYYPALLRLGISFSATLLAILFAHEMGHFLYCVRYRIFATLPYFIPAPTPIGTMGAFIRIKSVISSKAALFDIGIGGPIAGFVLAVPLMFLGLHWSKPISSGAEVSSLGYPLIFDLAARGLHMGDLHNWQLHPVAIAAWVGMFATALNLVPAGQFDGGHILYALTPRHHMRISRISVVALLPLAWFYWTGWLVWALLLAFFPRHAYVPDYAPLDKKRRAASLLGVAMLVLTFIPQPFTGGGIRDVVNQYRASRATTTRARPCPRSGWCAAPALPRHG
jgi:hypothetical protein